MQARGPTRDTGRSSSFCGRWYGHRLLWRSIFTGTRIIDIHRVLLLLLSPVRCFFSRFIDERMALLIPAAVLAAAAPPEFSWRCSWMSGFWVYSTAAVGQDEKACKEDQRVGFDSLATLNLWLLISFIDYCFVICCSGHGYWELVVQQGMLALFFSFRFVFLDEIESKMRWK